LYAVQLLGGPGLAAILLLLIVFGALAAGLVLLIMHYARRNSTHADSPEVPPFTPANWRYLSQSIEQNRKDIRILDKAVKRLTDRVANLESLRRTTPPIPPSERYGLVTGSTREVDLGRQGSHDLSSYSDHENSHLVPIEAKDTYQRLIAEGYRSTVTRMYVVPHEGGDNRGIVVGDSPREFKESRDTDSPFVILTRSDSSAAWLFPNPFIYFTEAMKYVFPLLSREQFDSNKSAIEPLRVRQRLDGVWEIT
jgi:hypothetical protein